MFAVLARLLRYTLPYRRDMWAALGLLLIATAADVVGPLLAKVFIDDYLMPGNWQFWDITALAAGFLLANVAAAYFGYGQSIRLARVAHRVVEAIRNQIFGHLMALPIRRFDYTPVGSMVSRVTNDTETIKELYVSVLGVYFESTIKIIGIFIAMAFLDMRMMLVCLLFLPVVVLIMYTYRRLSTPVFGRGRKLLADINGALNESIQGMDVIQLFRQELRFAQRFKQLNQNYLTTRLRTVRMDALLLRPLVELLKLFTLIGLLYVAGVEVLAADTVTGAVQVGVLYAFVNYLGRFVEPLIEMTQRLNMLQQALVSATRVFNWLDEPTDQGATNVKATGIPDGPLDVECRDVSFAYDEQYVLRDIALKVPHGSFLGIVGHTGSGKSTLVNLLLGFYPPNQGNITIGGVALSALSVDWLRRQVAIVQQDSTLFTGTLYDNIDMGRELSPQRVEAAAKAVGLSAFLERSATGLQHNLVERGGNLSTGQRQMVCFARALAGDPSILILDEATASIDSETEQHIQNTLATLKGRVTVIAIAHRLSTVVDADNLVVLHQGAIMQQGTHVQLLAEEGLYKHLYELQRLEQR